MKDPAFLFYTNDFYSGISDLTMEERGQYITLLCLQHLKGHLSEKTIQLAVGKPSEDVMKKFTLDENGLYFNKRLQLEISKRAEYAEKQRERVNKRWNKNNTTATTTEHTMVNTTVIPKIEDINEDENKDEISLGKEGVGEKPFQSKPEFVHEFGDYEILLQDLTEKSGANEVLMMQNRIDQKELDKLAEEFVNMLKSQKKFDGVKDERRYFTNWLPKRKQALQSQKQEPKPQTAKLRINKDLD